MSERITDRRHPEWREHQIRWRWLLDSYEGGNAYRQAVYGTDSKGQPVRNLIRHKREYPDPREMQESTSSVYPAGSARSIQALGHAALALSQDQAALATDDDYELRRARTPVPTFVREAIETHLGKIYDREIERETQNDALTTWWGDVDGKGTSIDDWMADTVAPVFLALGQIDLLFDRPRTPEGETVRSRADQTRLGLDRVIASLVLPENVVWWRLDPTGRRYTEAIVREYPDDATDDRSCTYRHWTETDSTLYDHQGKAIGEPVQHGLGFCPLVRIFDRRKVRCRNVGQSRYEGIAERQREYYNRDSELILSDTTQAHPLLQGPEDYVQADGSIPVGPNWLLPKKKNTTGGTSVSYEGFDVVDFPKDGAESLRKNKSDIRDDVDRDAGLTKPAGAAGSSRGTVAQSGVSKRLDSVDGNARLGALAKSLARVERTAAEMVLSVLLGRIDVEAEMASVKIVYPTTFDLDSVEEITTGTAAFQDLLDRSGRAPETEAALLCKLVRLLLPGRADETYDELEDEIERAIEASAAQIQQGQEAARAMQAGEDPGMDPADPAEPEPDDDPTPDPNDSETETED